MGDKKYTTSGQLMEAIRKQNYEKRYRICEEFYNILMETDFFNDDPACEDFKFIFEETELEATHNEFRQIMRSVNEMEIVLFDIDFYEPSTFFRIVERLRPIIER